MVLARKVRAAVEPAAATSGSATPSSASTSAGSCASSSGRGPVPMKHLVQDFNGDGEFDNYFHLKAMSIVGNVGGDRSGYVAAQRVGQLVGSGPGQRREPRHLLEQGAGAALPEAHRLLVHELPAVRGRRTRSSARVTTRPVTTGPAGVRRRRGRRVRGRHAVLPDRSRPVRQLRAGLTACRTSCGSARVDDSGLAAADARGPAGRRVRRRPAGVDVLDPARHPPRRLACRRGPWPVRRAPWPKPLRATPGRSGPDHGARLRHRRRVLRPRRGAGRAARGRSGCGTSRAWTSGSTSRVGWCRRSPGRSDRDIARAAGRDRGGDRGAAVGRCRAVRRLRHPARCGPRGRGARPRLRRRPRLRQPAHEPGRRGPRVLRDPAPARLGTAGRRRATAAPRSRSTSPRPTSPAGWTCSAASSTPDAST